MNFALPQYRYGQPAPISTATGNTGQFGFGGSPATMDFLTQLNELLRGNRREQFGHETQLFDKQLGEGRRQFDVGVADKYKQLDALLRNKIIEGSVARLQANPLPIHRGTLAEAMPWRTFGN